MSLRASIVAALWLGMLAPVPAWAQYPGQVAKSTKDAPELRSIAVVEWVGEAGKPKASRIVPVALLDEGKLQDAGLYLSRPVPLALAGEVEYELQRNGQPIGLFDVGNTGLEQGGWVGHGAWKPLPAAKPKPSAKELAQAKIQDEDGDRPVLHRKKHPGEAPEDGEGKPTGASGGGSASSGKDAPAADPDRPTLHKKDSSAEDAGETGPAPDPDRPTLHKKSADDQTSGVSKDDGPVLKKSKKKVEDVARVDSLPDVSDPDRPRLKRGKPTGNGLEVAPSLIGLPPDMQQAVAVSDVKTRPEHPWGYSWANPDDEAKMKSELEEMARSALGLNPPPQPPAPAPKRPAGRRTAKPAAPPEPPPPAPLVDEQFRVFELAYGSGATLVLSARTDGPTAKAKYVTLVAQPDLYGNLLVLHKSLADGAHLDETPRMRLVDAVDALADNRGELLFELRGATERQFALYRVLRGQAEQIFATGSAEFGSAAN